MSSTIINIETLLESSNKVRNVYDNYDNLLSVVKYDKNDNVDYVLKTKINSPGKSVETTKFEQLQVDINRPVADVTGDSARLRARVYKNENSKIFETGFIYWVGNTNESILGKPRIRNIFETPNPFKGNFSQTLTDLQDNTTYNYRAYAVHEYGTNYSPVAQFTTISYASIFTIVGDRFSGPSPLTVNLSAINAGFGNYTYAWNMTGGSIGFNYPLNSITVTFSGEGYTPTTNNYTITSVNVTLSGSGYDSSAFTNVLVNGTPVQELTANFALDNTLATYGISSVSVPTEALSGFKTNSLVITFSSSNSSSITQTASGLGSGRTYVINRENIILVDGTYQPSLSVVTFLNPENGQYSLSAIKFLNGPIVYSTSSRSIQLSTNGSVTRSAVIVPNSTIGITNAKYIGRTITHTYSSGGNFTAKVYAILGDQIDKQAIKVIRATGTSDYAPLWQPVLTSPFANNIIAAYDFRNLAGSYELNKFPYEVLDFEPQNILIGGYPYSIGGYLPWNKTPDVKIVSNLVLTTVGGYGGTYNLAGYLRHGIGGYEIAGYNYDALFGPGIVGENGLALRFDPLSSFQSVMAGYNFDGMGGYAFIGGYPIFTGNSWVSYDATPVFNRGNPFTLSMWVNMNEFREPGTKLFSVLPWGWWNNPLEFSITQSTTALKFFKNTYLDEVVGGYLGTFEPVAGYFTGFPVLCTSDVSKMLTPNAWNHLVITRDNKNSYKYYKNGSFMLSSIDVDPFGSFDAYGVGGYGNLGGYYGFGGDWLNPNRGIGGYVNVTSIGNTFLHSTRTAPASGLIDSVAIWKKELKESEIIELYNNGEGTDGIGYYRPIVGPRLFIGGMGTRNSNQINTILDTDGDIYWDNVSFYSKFDGTQGSTDIIDSSVNNVTLSSNGGAIIDTTVKKYGSGSVKFNGIGGYVHMLSGQNFGDFGTDEFTIEWWEYIAGYGVPSSVGGYYSPIMFYGNPGYGQYDMWNSGQETFRMNPKWGIVRAEVGGYGRGAGLRFYTGDTPRWNRFIEFTENFASPGGGFALSGWNHHVIQKRNYNSGLGPAGDLMWFKNGAIAGYRFNFDVNIGGYRTNLAGYGPGTSVIGAGIIGGYSMEELAPEWHYLDGYIDELRITKGVARYSSNFTIPASSYPTELGNPVGTKFKPVNGQGTGGSFAVAKESVNFTYPHTLAFIGKLNATTTQRTILQNLQTSYNSLNVQYFPGNLTPVERVLASSVAPFQGGLLPTNAAGSTYFAGVNAIHPVGGYPYRIPYVPFGNEWFYISYSFLGPNNNNDIRYYLQTPTVSGEGIIGGYNMPSFAGIPGFGIGGYALGGYFSSSDSVERPVNTIDGTVRLGVYINQGFNNHNDMVTLFKTLTSGPASDLTLQ